MHRFLETPKHIYRFVGVGNRCQRCGRGCFSDFPSPSQVLQQRGYPPFRWMFPESTKTVFESLFWYRSQGEKAWHDERFGNLKPDTSWQECFRLVFAFFLVDQIRLWSKKKTCNAGDNHLPGGISPQKHGNGVVSSVRSQPQENVEKPSDQFTHTGTVDDFQWFWCQPRKKPFYFSLYCLFHLGILIMVHYNPDITG